MAPLKQLREGIGGREPCGQGCFLYAYREITELITGVAQAGVGQVLSEGSARFSFQSMSQP
jgi:hypothetical protein